MVIQIRIKGMEGVMKLASNLPKTMEIEIPKGMMEFAKAVQKSAKLRAPKATGFLASQIKVRKISPKTIHIDTGEAYYALAQEFGYTPHVIPVEYIRQHFEASPNVPGRFVSRPRKFVTVSKFTPFMFPALEANIPNLRNILGKKVNIAINKARKGG